MKKLDFTIRPATKKDQDVLVDFRYKLDVFEHTYNPAHPKPTKAEVAKSIGKELKSKNHFFYIAEVNQKPVGYSHALIKIVDSANKRKGVMEAAWVEPKYRKQGVARALSEIRLDKLRKFKLETIKVYIRPKNQASIHNIEKLGGKHTMNVYEFKPKNK